MKKIAIILLSLVMVFVLVACGGNTSTNTDTDNKDTNTEIDNTTNTDNGNQGGEKPEPEPEVPQVPTYESSTVKDSLGEELNVFEKETTFGNEGAYGFTTTETIDVSKYLNTTIKIEKGGMYRIIGTSTDGRIHIDASNAEEGDKDVYLVLAGVSLTSKTSDTIPTIYAEDCTSVTIILEDGTENYLADNETNDGEGAVIRVRSCPLTLDGTGSLTIEAKAKNAIANTKELTINGGKYAINAPGHGIYGKLGVTINGGTFDIDAEKSGIKSGDGDNTSNYEYGKINVNAGKIAISCGTNGFNCVGPVTIKNGRIDVNAKNGNAIDALQNVSIDGGTLVLNSFKSAIATDADVTISSDSSVKIETTGNGISATNVTISTKGVIYIVTSPVYELATVDTPEDETKYVLKDGDYSVFNPDTDAPNSKLYVLRSCKGIKADSLTATKGTIGIDAYQDAINVDDLNISGGRFVLKSTRDAIEAINANISKNANITIIGAEKGINASIVTVTGGAIYAVAEKDSINADSTTISGGTVYLFDKIDKGTSGNITVNGGTLLVFATTNTPMDTEGNAYYISANVTNKDVAFAGNWAKVISGDDMVVVELPKNYTEKMTVYFASPIMGNTLMVTIGTVDDEGTFTVIKTENIQK